MTVVSLWTGWSVEPELIASICPRGIFQNGNLPARKESRGVMMIIVSIVDDKMHGEVCLTWSSSDFNKVLICRWIKLEKW